MAHSSMGATGFKLMDLEMSMLAGKNLWGRFEKTLAGLGAMVLILASVSGMALAADGDSPVTAQAANTVTISSDTTWSTDVLNALTSDTTYVVEPGATLTLDATQTFGASNLNVTFRGSGTIKRGDNCTGDMFYLLYNSDNTACNGETLTFTDVTVDGNKGIAATGSIVEANLRGGSDTINLSGSAVLQNNWASEGGAAHMWAWDSGVCYFNMSGTASIQDNTATDGGGLYVHSAYNNSAKTFVTMSDSSAIKRNTATNGGGVFIYDEASSSDHRFVMSGTAVIGSNSTIADANVAQYGGGIYIRRCNGLPTLENMNISYNKAETSTAGEYGYGGGIYSTGIEYYLTGQSTKVNHNQADYGGGISCSNSDLGASCIVHLENGSTVSDNTAVHDGGGIWAVCDTLNGGAGYDYTSFCTDPNFNGSFVYVKDSTISNNRAGGSGGGICSSVNMRNTGYPVIIHAKTLVYGTSEITGNYAKGDGGGIYCETVTLPLGGGDASAYIYGAAEISGNTSDGTGAGICTNANLKVSDSPVVKSNTVAGAASNVYLAKDLDGNKNHVVCPLDSSNALAPLSGGANIGIELQDAVSGDCLLSHDDASNCTNDEAAYFTLANVGATAALDSSGIKPANLVLTVPGSKSSTKAITSFSIGNGYTSTIDQSAGTITTNVTEDFDVTALAPTFTSVGDKAVVTVDGVTQESGVTTHDFTNPVVYTVTAEDGTTRNYTVSVNTTISATKALLTFSLSDSSGTFNAVGTVNQNSDSTGAKSVTVTVPYGTNLASTPLVATFTASPGAIVRIGTKVQTSGSTSNSFASQVTYKVYAASSPSSNAATYVVTVKVGERTSGEKFTYPVAFVPTDPSSTQTTVPCTFSALTYPNGDTPGTVEVSTNSGATAVDSSTAGSITIPSTVTNAAGEVFTVVGVGSNAFGFYSGNSTPLLTKVSLPDTVTSIGYGAFDNSGVTVVEFPKSTSYIGTDVLAHSIYYPSTTVTAIFDGNADGITSNHSNWSFRYLNMIDSASGKATFNVVFRGDRYIDKYFGDYYEGAPNNGVPTYYYTVRFYDTQEHAKTAQASKALDSTGENGCLGQVAVLGGTKLSDITSSLASSKIYDGSVPNMPDGMSSWLYTGGLSTDANLTDSAYAYASDVLPTQTDIESFSINGVAGTVNADAHTVSVTLPYGTDVTSLKPTFALSDGASAYVGGNLQTSGFTQVSFESPATYTIKAGDGVTTQDWTITVALTPNSEARLYSFEVAGATGVVDEVMHTVSVTAPYGTDVSSLVAKFKLSDQASAKIGSVSQTSGSTANDFTNTVTYTVTAGDGATTQDYAVTVQASKLSIDDVNIAEIPTQHFTGSAITPTLTVTYGDKTLVLGNDYTVAYHDNVAVGDQSASVVVSGIGDCEGERTVYFSIANSSRNAIQFAGSNRYDTASLIAASAFGDLGSDYVIVATGEGYADALAASGLAGVLKCPIITTSGAALSTEASTELTKLAPSHIVMVGGTSVLSENVESSLKSIPGVVTVERLAGSNRYETCSKIYAYGQSHGGFSGVPIIATGNGYADALSVAPIAYKQKSPIILVSGDAPSDSLASALKADCQGKQAIICGGESAVTASIENWLTTNLGTAPLRLAGGNRYETSAKIASWGIENAGFTYDTVTFATGSNFADALAGGPLCGKTSSPLLLIDDKTSGDAAVNSISSYGSSISVARFLGGNSALSYSYRDTVLDLLGGGFTKEWN